MFVKVSLSIFVAAALLCVSASAVETPSELLEKGIYTEETVGDLDKAIKIYEEVISQDKANRKFVAQAQLRLGKCQLKQGNKEAAEKTFRELVDQFKDSSDQKQLVATARTLLPNNDGELKLDPVPWVDGEHLELRVRLAAGLEIGDFILTARSDEIDGRKVWHLGLNRNISVNPPNLGLSHVVADWQTFRPVSSVFKHTLLGNVVADYKPGKVMIRTVGDDEKESVKTLDLDGVCYDNEQGWHLFRRLPLTDKYVGETPICATFGGGAMKLNVEVTGIETVEVPAGKFECYRLFLKPVQQTFWISTDANRYVVKFEAGGVNGVLQSIRKVKAGAKVDYSDEKLGFSLSAPADWYFIPSKRDEDTPSRTIMLVDPGADGVNSLHVEPLDKLRDEHKTSVRAWAEHKTEDYKEANKNFQVAADSWQERTVAGKPAVSFVANFNQGNMKRTTYHVFVLGESTASRFEANTAPDRLDDLRREFDMIIDTYKVE